MATLAGTGISMQDVTDKLLTQGVQLFSDAFDKLLNAVGQQGKDIGSGKINRQTYKLSESLAAGLKASLEDWRAQGKVRKLWARDASLWTGADEGQWLGWLGITNGQLAHIDRLKTISKQAKAGGFSHVMLLGMGGSSLGPEVMAKTFGKIAGYPELHVLDSTDPAQVKLFANKVDLGKTLFIVSSKSGSTLEPNIFKQYFFERLTQVVGNKEAGNRFIAITDPGSKMQKVAESDGFRRIFFGLPSIGGRYSVLSDFGLVPAAAMGVDVPKFLDRAEEMVQACMPSVPVEDNPSVVLGLILGTAHDHGRNKLTLITSPGIGALGAWLEQLLAGSTGKGGKGIIPVDCESVAAPAVYGSDRLFVYVRLDAAPDRGQDAAVEALENAGHPVVRIAVDEIYDLGEEFFRWEIATAVAGSVIGIHPFDQPDVEAGKVATRKLTSDYEQTGKRPLESPFFEEGGLKLFTDDKNATALGTARGKSPSLSAYLKAHLNRIEAGDYFALLAYIEMNEVHETRLPSYTTCRAGQQAGCDLSRLRSALPPLGRAGLQGGAEHGRVSADHVRRRRRRADSRPEVHVRHREGGTGPQRFSGLGRTGASDPANPSGQRRRSGAGQAGGSHQSGVGMTMPAGSPLRRSLSRRSHGFCPHVSP